MAVYIFEGVAQIIGNRHQLDHTVVGVAGHAGTFVKRLPAQKVGLDGVGYAAQTDIKPLALHDGGHIMGAEERGRNKGGGSHGADLWWGMH